MTFIFAKSKCNPGVTEMGQERGNNRMYQECLKMKLKILMSMKDYLFVIILPYWASIILVDQ